MNKIIHYCWFGGSSLPPLALKCIESWKKYCPDYEIKEWNESNFDINCCVYVKEAYECKKWAFVSDYARFWILYHEGGLYFDTDVEIIKILDDLVDKGPFMGSEGNSGAPGLNFGINPGLGLVAKPGLELYREILDFYDKKHFINEDGMPDQTTVVSYTTDILLKHGLQDKTGVQKVGEIYVYPPEYFCPLDYETGILNITENTRTIHHYSASWFDKKMIRRRRVTTEIRNRVKGRKAELMCEIYMKISSALEYIQTGNTKVIFKKIMRRINRKINMFKSEV